MTIQGSFSGRGASPSVVPFSAGNRVGQAVVVLGDDDARVRVLGLSSVHTLHPGVEGRHVLGPSVREELVPTLHFVDRPFKGGGRLLHVGHDGQEHVGDAVERRELDDLGVDHEQAQLVRRPPVEEREQHHVEADALARAGRARDDDVRHAREVRVHGVSENVAPEHDGQGHVERLETGVLDEIPQQDLDPPVVRELEPDAVLAGDGGHDAHLPRKSQGEVVGEPGDFRDLRPCRWRHLVGRHGGAWENVLDLALDPVVRQGLDERVGVGEQLLAVDGQARVDLLRDEEVHARKLERRGGTRPIDEGLLFLQRGRRIDDGRRGGLARPAGLQRRRLDLEGARVGVVRRGREGGWIESIESQCDLGRGLRGGPSRLHGLHDDRFCRLRRLGHDGRSARLATAGRAARLHDGLGQSVVCVERQRGNDRLVGRRSVDMRLAGEASNVLALSFDRPGLPPRIANCAGALGGPGCRPRREVGAHPGERDKREGRTANENQAEAREPDEERPGRGEERATELPEELSYETARGVCPECHSAGGTHLDERGRDHGHQQVARAPPRRCRALATPHEGDAD